MNSDTKDFDTLKTMIRSYVPGFEVCFKDEVLWQRIIGWLMFYNRDYATKYTSTFGTKVYFPSRRFVEDNKRRAVKILAHEYVHLWDRRWLPIIFEVLYLCPQVLALLAALFWLSPWFLLTLAFALPFPAFFRAVLEMRGYAMGIAINYYRYGAILPSTRERIISRFAGAGYYFMWPFRKQVSEWLLRVERGVRKKEADGVLWESSTPYRHVHSILGMGASKK